MVKTLFATLLFGFPILAHAAPVTTPYEENFATTAGSFSSAGTASTSWTPVSGKLRAQITAGGVAAAATVQAPAFVNGFTMKATLAVVANGNNDNTCGVAFLGGDAVLSGTSGPYYLADIKPGTNAIRLVRISSATTFMIDNEPLEFTLNPSQPFTISVEGTNVNTALRITVRVRQGANESVHVDEDEFPLTGTFFGLRCRTASSTMTIDYDDFSLRPLTTVDFTATPVGFARPGIPYESIVAAHSSADGNVAITAEEIPAWMTATANGNGTLTLSGTPPAGVTGSTLVKLKADDGNGPPLVREFPLTVLGISGVIISEFVASNDGSFLDEDGLDADWLELFNANSSPADLSGWMLKDDKTSWTIPAGVVLPPYGTLVVFASDKNRGSATTPLHTNFKLSASANGRLALTDPAGTIVSEYAAYPAQREGVSYGAWGTYETTGYLLAPTPGAVNAPRGFIGFASDPTFSVQRGVFSAPQTVTISSSLAGSSFAYTLDGSLPTLTNGTQIAPANAISFPTATLTISSTSVVRAVVFLENYAPSTAITNTYLFPDDIIAQSANGSPPAGWPAGPINSQVLDYGMDPDITTGKTAELKAALAQLPSFSMVTDRAHLFDKATGIYVNAYGREEEWERPTSLEMIKPDGTSAFQVNCGMRIRGGASRVGTNPKHGFHLYFRGEYGAKKLNYPLFDSEGTTEFDRIDLRCTQGSSWHHTNTSSATYMKDEWSRATQGAMGHAYARSRYAHLFINGQYWGIFTTQERADNSYAASYFGGEKEDYDVIKTYVLPHRVEAADGDAVAWNSLHSAATAGFGTDAAYFAVQGLDAPGQPSATLKPLVEIDNLIDYMILNMYTSNTDGPINPGAGVPKNFYCFRPRDGSAGFRFVAHDFEDTMNGSNVTGTTNVGSTLPYFNPRWLHVQLTQNARYRQRFADRVQRNLFNTGALATTNSVLRWTSMRDHLRPAMIAESARWGDAKSNTPHTVAEWESATRNIELNYLPARANGLISQLRGVSPVPLFPSINAPVFSKFGGVIAAGFPLAITADAGLQIYYTTDGSDPSISGALYQNAVALNRASVTVKARAKVTATGEWSALTEALFTQQPVAAAAGNLVLSEFNYNPPGPDDLDEFIEVYNPSTSLVDLTGVKLTTAVTFTFPSLLLEPGQRITVIKDETAFRAVHGPSPRIAGIWSGSLNQSGEAIVLVGANGVEIERVFYGVTLPWPTAAANNGRSLVRIRADLPANNATSWRPSAADNGHPSASDSASLAAWLANHGFADAGSLTPAGTKALVHFASGTELISGKNPDVQLITTEANTRLTFQRTISALDDVRYFIDQSTDLVDWSNSVEIDSAAANVTARTANGLNESLTVQFPAGGGTKFFRIRYVTR